MFSAGCSSILGVLSGVSSFVVTANVPTTNPWPIIGAGLALILLGLVVRSTEGRESAPTRLTRLLTRDPISHDD